MSSAVQWKKALQSSACDETLCRLYMTDDPLPQRERYLRLLEEFTGRYGEREDVHFFSAPGRTELGGNHTDHQHGRVLAAAVTLDKLAVVSPQEDTVELGSKSHPLPPMDWRDMAHYKRERGHSPSLIRGVFAGLRQEGYAAGGFAGVSTLRCRPVRGFLLRQHLSCCWDRSKAGCITAGRSRRWRWRALDSTPRTSISVSPAV